jgi:hypothetical protein
MLQSIVTTQCWKHMLVDLTQRFIQTDLPGSKGRKTIYITPPQDWELREDPEVKRCSLRGKTTTIRHASL